MRRTRLPTRPLITEPARIPIFACASNAGSDANALFSYACASPSSGCCRISQNVRLSFAP